MQKQLKWCSSMIKMLNHQIDLLHMKNLEDMRYVVHTATGKIRISIF